MANRHQSAMRQHRRSLRSRARNRSNLSRLRTGLKTIRGHISEKRTAEAKELLNPTLSLVDHSVARRVLHRNAASRLKSRITKQVTALG